MLYVVHIVYLLLMNAKVSLLNLYAYIIHVKAAHSQARMTDKGFVSPFCVFPQT